MTQKQLCHLEGILQRIYHKQEIILETIVYGFAEFKFDDKILEITIMFLRIEHGLPQKSIWTYVAEISELFNINHCIVKVMSPNYGMVSLYFIKGLNVDRKQFLKEL